MKHILRYLPALALAVSFNISIAKAEMSSGAALAATCYSCHGTDGKSQAAMPSISGKSAKYIMRTMTAYRDGKRQSTVMGRIAKGFNDKEIKALAEYFAKQSK